MMHVLTGTRKLFACSSICRWTVAADHDNLPLQYACDNGHTEVARMLLDLPEPSYDDSCVLRNACEHGHTEIVRLLLDLPLGLTDARGLDEYIRTEMLINACENGNTELVRIFIDHRHSVVLDLKWAFQFACGESYIDIVRLLLEQGVNPSADDNAALKNACEGGQFDVVRLLLDLPVTCGVNLKNFSDEELYRLSVKSPGISAILMRHMITLAYGTEN